MHDFTLPHSSASSVSDSERGFTLIELSIVLIIIGLIVGGVLVGRSLIRAAEARSTLTQVEKFNTAANTFRGKYGYLPGDIPDPTASSFGFAARGQSGGQGDGDGIIRANFSNSSAGNSPHAQCAGEAPMFWVDLSKASLIDGSFTAASPTAIPSSVITMTSTPNLNSFLPQSKLGNSNYFYVYSDGPYPATYSQNFFALSAVTQISNTYNDDVSTAAMTVEQAYTMDKKADDGLPQSGNIMAFYVTTGGAIWAAGSGQGANVSGSPTTNATAATSTTCYDNGGVTGTQNYSMTTNNGTGVNCALSFKLQ